MTLALTITYLNISVALVATSYAQMNTETPTNSNSTLGDAKNVHDLVAEGADVNAKDKYGESPLHYAKDRGHVEASKVLINAEKKKHPWG